MTKEELNNKTDKLEVSCDLLNKNNKGIQRIEKQLIVFTSDIFIKGKSVEMTLLSEDSGINAPDYGIYFTHDQLKSILEFLLKQKGTF
jgi:hypothetical protein